MIPFYKKGLICLSQSFGLGAVAYFRRAVEEVIGHLLDLVEQAALLDPGKPDTAALAVVKAARASHQADVKLKAIAGVVPEHLKVHGENPLAKLYDAYSEGVHSLSDEDSVDTALTMRAILDHVLPGLHQQLRSARAYQAAMSKSARKLKPTKGTDQDLAKETGPGPSGTDENG